MNFNFNPHHKWMNRSKDNNDCYVETIIKFDIYGFHITSGIGKYFFFNICIYFLQNIRFVISITSLENCSCMKSKNFIDIDFYLYWYQCPSTLIFHQKVRRKVIRLCWFPKLSWFNWSQNFIAWNQLVDFVR